VKVGFLGLGVVGAELVNIIIKNTDRIYEKYGIKLELVKFMYEIQIKSAAWILPNLN
jgi:homoserine dehydrogenase